MARAQVFGHRPLLLALFPLLGIANPAPAPTADPHAPVPAVAPEESGEVDLWYPYVAKAWSEKTTNSNPICSAGRMQSPIDLPKCLEVDATRPALTITWRVANVTLVNNGHTVQATVVGDGGNMSVSGNKYTLVQCHWHWGSEHTIGGVQQDLAAHCVHTKNGENGKYGVVGIFYEVSTFANSFLALISDKLPSEPAEHRRLSDTAAAHAAVPVAAEKTPAGAISVNLALIHNGINLKEYWTYDGSFTTPPCTEAVDWYPLMGKAKMTAEQLQSFKDAMGWADAGGNYRPPQPLFNREVQGCIKEDWYPYKAYAWSSVVSGSNPVCMSGMFQSPIDLPACIGADITAREPIGINWGSQSFDLINNGHTVQLTLKDVVNKPQMKINGAKYTLLQCHFHWGSEHTVDGQQFPLAAHCVHKKDNTNRYGVLGIMYEVGAPNPFLRMIENYLPSSGAASTTRRLAGTAVKADFSGPLPFDMLHANLDKAKYWTYDGSLTTPPCSEVVDWYPLMTRATVSQAQLDKFKAAIGYGDAKGNYRPPQPRKGQVVEGCTPSDWYPYSDKTWSEDVTQANDVCQAGSMQSPVDLPKCEQAKKRDPLSVKWGIKPVKLLNNGHTVQLTVDGLGGRMRSSSNSYTLVQCHWHWGSEHTVGGEQQQMVVHCVHTKDSYPGKYGVLGIFYEVGETPNDFLARIEDVLPVMAPEEVHHRRLAAAGPLYADFKEMLDFDTIHAHLSLSKYWTYDGSFTTPPCTEAVDWHVLMDYAPITKTQLNKFSTAMGWVSAGGNFRPPQPLNGRSIVGCESTWYPYRNDAWAKSVSTPGAACAEGNFQSPIDLPTCDKASSRVQITTTWANSNVTIVNNGHTVQLNVEKTDFRMTFGGSTYTLVQCHFHWGSEHTIDGEQQDMVAHCVQTKDGVAGRYGVLGIFYQVVDGAQPDPFLAEIEDQLPGRPVEHRRLSGDAAAATSATSSDEGGLDFSKIYAKIDLTKYWSYSGSLTTPPCSEVVDWYPLMGYVPITKAQLDKFKAAIGSWSGSGNFRPPQPLKGRDVFGCDEVEAAGASSMFSSGALMVAVATAAAATIAM